MKIEASALLAAALLTARAAPAELKELRIAVIVEPGKGNPWAKGQQALAEEVARDGQVHVNYVPRTEARLVDELKAGSVDCATLPAISASEFYPAAIVGQFPGVRTLAKFQELVRKTRADIAAGFAANGYEMLSWWLFGFYTFQSKVPVRVPDDLSGLTMCAWPGDSIQNALSNIVGSIKQTRCLTSNVLQKVESGAADVVPLPVFFSEQHQVLNKMKFVWGESVGPLSGFLLCRKSWSDGMSAIEAARIRQIVLKQEEKIEQAVEAFEAGALQRARGRGSVLSAKLRS